MNGRTSHRRLFLAILQTLAAFWLCACSVSPLTPEAGVLSPSIERPAQTLTSARLPTTPATTSSPTATFTPFAVGIRTDTPTITEQPLAISNPSLGYDCSQVERIPVSSAEARRLAQALVAAYKEKLPTEHIAVEDLWAVDRLDEYVLLQMRVSDEAAGVFAIRQPRVGPSGIPPKDAQAEYLAGQVWGGWPLPSRYIFPEYFTAQLPDVSPELFYCMSLEHYTFQIAAEEELNLQRHADCAVIQSIQVDSPIGWPISHALVDYWSGVIEVASVELDQVYSIQQMGPFYAIQVRFLVNHRPQPPEIFIAKDTTGGYQFLAQTGGGGPDRSFVLRTLYAQDPSIPSELLACLSLDSWLLDTPTPAP